MWLETFCDTFDLFMMLKYEMNKKDKNFSVVHVFSPHVRTHKKLSQKIKKGILNIFLPFWPFYSSNEKKINKKAKKMYAYIRCACKLQKVERNIFYLKKNNLKHYKMDKYVIIFFLNLIFKFYESDETQYTRMFFLVMHMNIYIYIYIYI